MDLQTLLDQGARPVCLEVLPVKAPFFVELDNELSIEDRVIIDDFMDWAGYRVIPRNRDPSAEN